MQHSQWRWTSSFIQPTSCRHTSSKSRSRTAWRRHRYGETGGREWCLRPDSEQSCSHSSSLLKTGVDNYNQTQRHVDSSWCLDLVSGKRAILCSMRKVNNSQVPAIKSQVFLHQTLHFNHSRLVMTAGATGGARGPIQLCWGGPDQCRSPALHIQPFHQDKGTYI